VWNEVTRTFLLQLWRHLADLPGIEFVFYVIGLAIWIIGDAALRRIATFDGGHIEVDLTAQERIERTLMRR
jgi:hypothetical protein